MIISQDVFQFVGVVPCVGATMGFITLLFAQWITRMIASISQSDDE